MMRRRRRRRRRRRLKIAKRPQAFLDLDEAATYILQDNPDAARRFLEAVEAQLETLAEFPGIGAPCEFRSPRAAGLRRTTVKGFRDYVIFYRTTEDAIEVVRVLHGARDIESIFEV